MRNLSSSVHACDSSDVSRFMRFWSVIRDISLLNGTCQTTDIARGHMQGATVFDGNLICTLADLTYRRQEC